MQVIMDWTCRTTHGRMYKFMPYFSRKILIEETVTNTWAYVESGVQMFVQE
jgi:hypothetical protein